MDGMVDEAGLEQQAEQMAAKSLASLPAKAREAKLPAVKAGILKRLLEQATRGKPVLDAPVAAPPPAPAAAPAAGDAGPRGAPPPPPEIYDPFQPAQVFAVEAQQRAAELYNPFSGSRSGPRLAAEDEELDQRPPGLRRPPTELPPPQDGVEACGDDPWFADPEIRLALRDAVQVAHTEFKILVGNPSEEIARICPQDGRELRAGAVMRLGGHHLGGYGEADVTYAYRQLSRALHPDKNRNNPDAATAFKRLHDAQTELKEGMVATRGAVKRLAAPFSSSSLSEEELVRPQEALFAGAARLLAALLALSSEGQVSLAAKRRAAAMLQVAASSGGGNWALPRGAPETLLSRWFSSEDLLKEISAPTLRGAYDCAPKRYRAHFLCLLARAAQLEGQRSDGCVRHLWTAVWEVFPELNLVQELFGVLRRKCQVHGRDPQAAPLWLPRPRSRSRSPRPEGKSRSRAGANSKAEEANEGWSQWARRWRRMISAVLPGGEATATPWSDPEVRKLCAALWRDFVDPLGQSEAANTEGARRSLGLFRTESRGAADVAAQRGAAPAEWAYVPAADLLLIVGEGLVGCTVEGVFVAGTSAERSPFASAIFQTML